MGILMILYIDDTTTYSATDFSVDNNLAHNNIAINDKNSLLAVYDTNKLNLNADESNFALVLIDKLPDGIFYANQFWTEDCSQEKLDSVLAKISRIYTEINNHSKLTTLFYSLDSNKRNLRDYLYFNKSRSQQSDERY